jgi:nucleoside-diphosphate-sugar epimerase
MRVAVTGGGGRLASVLIPMLIEKNYSVSSLDWKTPQVQYPDDTVTWIKIDLNHLDAVISAFQSCDAVIHLAAYTNPDGQPPGEVYINNTRASYNVLYAASALGIRKVCLASSVNALGGIGAHRACYEYLPIDEKHPTFNMDDYSLSKWVMEQQADSFARRFPEMTISSLRIHAIPDEPPSELQNILEEPESPGARGLWGWTLISEAARACMLAVKASFQGHEIFYIIAPYTYSAVPSVELARHTFPNVPIRGDLSGHNSFYDCRKAARLLGFIHI